MYPVVVQIQKLVSANVCQNVFGFDMSANIGKVWKEERTQFNFFTTWLFFNSGRLRRFKLRHHSRSPFHSCLVVDPTCRV
jgi:hypothetical protein